MAETVEIEQDPRQPDRLQIVRKVDGVGAAPPVAVDSPEGRELLGDPNVTLARVKSGFGEFSLRKRRRGEGYWVAFRHIASEEKEIGVGRTDAITSALLDDCAVQLYK